MKLSVLQENLAKALSTVSRSVATKAQLPVLENILLVTDQGRLKLSATNLEIGINYWIGAKIEKEGAISIPAKILTEFVSSLPADKIDLELKENKLTLVSGMYKASFAGLAASEFPSVPTLGGKSMLLFNPQDFSFAISQVAFAAAQDEGRPVLTGVLLLIKDKDLLLVATDGYRLSLKKVKEVKGIEKVKELKKGLLIPARVLIEVGRIIGGEKEEKKLGLAITSDSNQAIFTTSESEIVSRLIEEKFPDFEKIIPGEGKTKATLETEELLRAVRTASIFARESANIVKFKIQDSKFKISANAPQVGDNLIEVEAKIKGEGKIAFNSRYLLDFLSVADSELINFEMSGSLNPGVFTPVNDDSYLHIIMPVRVQE